MKQTTLFLFDLVCNSAPLISFISLIPFVGMFLGDMEEFKKKVWPFALATLTFVVNCACIITINSINDDISIVSDYTVVYSIAAAMSFISVCGLYLFRTDQYYVFEFLLEYYIIGGLISLKNLVPKKVTMHRTALVLISPSQWSKWFKDQAMDSSQDKSYGKLQQTKKMVKEEVYIE